MVLVAPESGEAHLTQVEVRCRSFRVAWRLKPPHRLVISVFFLQILREWPKLRTFNFLGSASPHLLLLMER